MNTRTNLILLLAVVALVVLPLKLVKRPTPGPDGQEVEIFLGADDQAKEMVSRISPTYKPWARPLITPPSSEIGSLLFALQAAIGAGFIGYYLGSRVTRAKLAREAAGNS
ncbi:MAG: Cobalt transport protein CbiN [Holophagaceae bacterium]|nr:Cobalt transport protein CbiN [Holophagaceae bacterium]